MYSITIEGPDVRIALPEALTLQTRTPLRRMVTDALRTPPRRIILDCSATERIDASGLGTLIALRSDARGEHAELVLSDPHPALRAALEQTQMTSIFFPEPRRGGAS